MMEIPEKNSGKKLRESQSAKEKERDKELKNIYKIDGKMPDMVRLDHKKKSRLKSLIILILVLIIIFAVSVLGFFVFQPKPNFTGDKINLEVKAPFNTVSGERIEYDIKIYNGEEVSLGKLQLSVYLPSDFIFENSTLMSKLQSQENSGLNPNIKLYKLDDLFSNQTQEISITGKLLGPINSKQTISATLSYRPSNFNSEFQKNISFDTQITDSLADLDLEYPSQVANSEDTGFIIDLNNKSQETEISNLQVELDYPAEFTLASSQIVQDNVKNPLVNEKPKSSSPKLWTIDKLLPQESVKIKFNGKFNVKESQGSQLQLKLGIKGPAEDYVSQRDQTFNIQIIKGDLLTNLIINGSSQDKPVDFGDTLNCLLSIENKSSKILGDLKIRAVLDSPVIDWTSLNDQNKGVQQDNQILWTKDQIPQLSVLIPEAEVDIPIQINLKGYRGIKGYKPEDLKVKSYFEAQINKIDNKDSQVVVQSNNITNQLNTDLDLQAQVRYFADDNSTIGSGPLPPIVGQKTTYKVFLKLTNSLHDITNIQVATKLPDYVTYEGNENVSAGALTITEQNQVVWQISGVPASVKETTAEFEISIMPIESDVNKILTLISEISMNATDSQTQGTISRAISGLTTNLETDNLGKNKGLVQPQ